MNGFTDDHDFKAATAMAAAAAAASSTTVQEHKSNNIEVTENLEKPESESWSLGECNFAEQDMQRSLREDTTAYPQFGWRDITKEFFDACQELEPGELAQDMLFGLFEAMSAIEIMDPKMDVGMGYNKDDAPPHTFETAVKAGVLKLENLTSPELIGIFDALFACFVSWLEGNSIDQVLFTCLYLHAPTEIKDAPLRSFCIAMRNIITIVKNIIKMNAVNEEEDFQLYGNATLLSAEDAQPTVVVTELKKAEDELIRKCKQLKKPDDLMAVVHRLRFMRHFFQMLHQVENVHTNIPADEQSINEIYKNLYVTQELVPQLRRTINKGIQPVPGSDEPNPMGFSIRIHDRSQPPTFPRTVKIRDRPSSIQFLEELVARIKYACKIIKHRDYYSVLNFFIDYSRKTGQCILSRSILQGIFISNRRLVFGTITMKDFLWASVRAFSSPPVLNLKHPIAADAKTQFYVESFFRHCINLNTFTQFIRLCGFNRARQREKLSRLIETFDSIQVEASRLDSHLTMLANETRDETHAAALMHSAQFSTWVLYNCFRAMLLYIMSGFELELYAVHEFLYIYWYPYELLIGFLVSALTRTENNLYIQDELAEQQKSNAVNCIKNRQKAKPKKNKKQQKPYRQEIIYYHALLNMCGGFYKAMGALTKDERIRQPMPKFDNEEIRYNRRFAPFIALTSPPPMSYMEFKTIRDVMMRPTSSEIYTQAAKHFDQARHLLESLQNPEHEMLDLIHVAKFNFVVMNVLAQGHQKELKRQPEFDFSKHRCFPIIKLN